MKKLIKASRVFTRILVVAFAFAALAGVGTLIQATQGGYFDKISYKTDSWDRKFDYELVEVMHERGKEPIYKVEINGKIRNVTEEVWQTYLGEDYNTITYHIESIKLCKEETFFGLFSTGYFEQEFWRGSYPWYGPIQPFTEQDAQTLVNDIYANEGWNNHLFQSETTVEFSSTSYCRHNEYFLDKSAIRCKNPEINWWWNWFI